MKTPHSPNRTPHKHAELIKSWADGSEIQCRHTHKEDWFTLQLSCNSEVAPAFKPEYEYRIKPETVKIKYRNYIYKGYAGTLYVESSQEGETDVESLKGFVRWIGDWVEVEV